MSEIEVLAVTGGVGGAKLALGLAHALAPGALACVVNTGDDFEHLGLQVCPDLDTTLYTLAGLANPELGWGRCDETWNFMRVLGQLGGETWFQLGDGDLALHVERTRRLAAGETLTTVMDEVRKRLDVPTRVLPMCDQPVRTRVQTASGTIDFQEYFVRLRAAPAVRAIQFDGAGHAHPTSALLEVLASPALRAIVVCPSNPWLSIDPILAVPGLRAALRAPGVPVVAVSPLVGGRAVKGPTAKIMAELGIDTSPRAIADHYGELLDGLVIDEADRAAAQPQSLPVRVTHTLMTTLEDRVSLACTTLAFGATLVARRPAN